MAAAKTGPKPIPLRERFESKFIPVTESGCWLWTASNTTDGYGQITFIDGDKRRKSGAHRIAWQLYRGQIPDGLDVCHHCDVKDCVNPEHLFLGTARDNMRDCFRKGRNPIASYRHRGVAAAAELKRAQTHCKRGHLLAGDNIYLQNNGRRRLCKTCHREYYKTYPRGIKLDGQLV